jgi:hypothetical protein
MANDAMMPTLPVTRSIALMRASTECLPYRPLRDKKTGRERRAPSVSLTPVSLSP